MRLWHYKLISVLPNKMLVSQWRELIAIKRQWEKGTLKHSLVSYVKDYDKWYFSNYVVKVANEMEKRNIKFKEKLLDELLEFASNPYTLLQFNYPEHNDRYLAQCYFNLQEKYDRGIVSEEEWVKINAYIKYLNKEGKICTN